MEKTKDLQLKIIVNGESVPIKPFVQDIVRNVIYTLVTSLKLKTEPEKIEVTLTKK